MTTEDGSSRSQSETHNEVRHTMRDSDAMALSRTLRYYLLRSYVELNHAPGTAVPMIEIAEPKAEDLAVLVENVSALVPLGLEVSSAELRERLGLREPKQGEALLQSTTQTPSATLAKGATHAMGANFAEFRSNLAKLAEDNSIWETKSANLADLLALASFKAWTEGAASTEDGEA